jgi:PIN domain nuclease of toxin-antitoxin system
MKVLLDTNALLWLLEDDPRLSQAARRAIESASKVIISEVSLWEISIKISIGKLQPVPELLDTVLNLGFNRMNLRDSDLKAYETLPLIHRDPFDRMLVVQALSEGASLITSDAKLKEYGVEVVLT